jgi:hypothetical protein
LIKNVHLHLISKESPNSKGLFWQLIDNMEEIELKSLIKELVTFSQETEFKLNFHSNEEIGKNFSLS